MLLDALKRADLPDVSTEDFDDEFGAELRPDILPDPEPGTSRSPATPAPARPATPAKAARRPVSRQIKKQLADELEAYAQLAALGWSTRDEHCSGVLSDQSRKIADALADIIARNPRLMEWVHTSGLVGDWVKLAMAVMPVVAAVRDHHVLKKVDDGTPGGVGGDYSGYAPYRPSA